MFRVIWETGLPFSFPCDPAATFIAGQAAMLTTIGGNICATPSNGLAFVGIFDDVRSKSFFNTAWDEVIISPIAQSNITTNGAGQLITIVDVKQELQNPNISVDSFVSLNVPCQLIPRNGIVVYPAGTVLNFDLEGSGTPSAIKNTVRYQYQVPNVVGDDTVGASQQCTIWMSRMIFSTSAFETNQQYQVNSNIFINETGFFTTRQIHPNSPAVGTVIGPPSAMFADLQILLL